jgi:hypothetical protein
MKLAILQLKTWNKQLLGSLPLNICSLVWHDHQLTTVLARDSCQLSMLEETKVHFFLCLMSIAYVYKCLLMAYNERWQDHFLQVDFCKTTKKSISNLARSDSWQDSNKLVLKCSTHNFILTFFHFKSCLALFMCLCAFRPI